VIRLGPWPLALALLPLLLIHERQAPAPDLPSRPRIEAASAAAPALPEPSLVTEGSLEPSPDPPVPVVALADDRGDDYEDGPMRDDREWGFLHLRRRGAQAGFERTVRLPVSPAQAKWLYRAWGQP
jgi:hypothetical protein